MMNEIKDKAIKEIMDKFLRGGLLENALSMAYDAGHDTGWQNEAENLAQNAEPNFRYATKEEVAEATEKGLKQYKNAFENLANCSESRPNIKESANRIMKQYKGALKNLEDK